MHIVLTVNAAWNILNFRAPLVQALVEDGHRVTILAPRDDAVEGLHALGAEFCELKMDVKGLNPIADGVLFFRFLRAYSKLKPDVILGFTIKNNLFGAMAAKRAGIAFVPNITGLGTAFLSSKMLERIAGFLYRRAFSKLPVVFFQNADDRWLFLEKALVHADQTQVLPGSGIDLQKFAPAPYPAADAPLRFLLVARLLRDKGIVEYVTAAQIVRKQFPQAQFQLLGAVDAQNRTAISRTELAQWVEDDKITYLGTTDDVRGPMAQAHAVVLPSYREGAPRTLIEAASLARPLIASDVPGCRSVIDDTETGYLCAVRNANALADCLLQFLELSHSQKEQMGRKGRKKMEDEFDVAHVIAAYRRAIDLISCQEGRA